MRGVFMANNIVQHRRGTTEEWKKLDLVPSEGELVIEECIDGTCKCKIGNGISKFSELAYLSDPLNTRAIELLAKQHQEDTTSIADKLAKLKDELKTDLKCLESNTETKINSLFIDALRLDLDNLISGVEQLENTVEAIKIAGMDKLHKLEKDLADLDNIVSELPVDSSINSSIEIASQSILIQVDEKIKTEKENYEAAANKVHTDIKNDLIDLHNTLIELRSSFSVQLVETQNNLSNSLDKKLNSTIPLLYSRVDNLEVSIEALESRLTNKIRETYSKINKEYGTQITNLQDMLIKLKQETNIALITWEENLEDLAHSVSKRFGIVEEDIYEVRNLYEDAMNKLAQVRSENNLLHLTLNKSIDDINDRISAIVNITEADVEAWREFSAVFLESSKKALYVSEDNELCAGIDILEAVVLDCGTA
jgi:hypothetical protein